MVDMGAEKRLTQRCYEKILESLLIVAHDIKTKGRIGTSVLNMSLGHSVAMVADQYMMVMRKCNY